MTRRSRALALLLVLPLSSSVVACDRKVDTDDRAAIDRQQLERDLDLAIQTDTTDEPQIADVPVVLPPVERPEPTPEPEPEPEPVREARRPAPRPAAPRREEPREEPRPEPVREIEPVGPRYVTRSVPSGSTFQVRFAQDVSTRMAVGEGFTATLAEALTDEEGRTVIPAGATVHGRVTSSRVSTRGGQRTDLGVAFTSVSYGGESYPLDATVVSLPAPRRVSRDSRGEQAAKVGGGAAVGAILGRVIGRDTRSTVAGAVIGAAAGTAVAVGTADVDQVIDAGSAATVRIDSPVRVRREA